MNHFQHLETICMHASRACKHDGASAYLTHKVARTGPDHSSDSVSSLFEINLIAGNKFHIQYSGC